MIKINILNEEQTDYHVTPHVVLRNTQGQLCSIPIRNLETEYNHEETLDKLKLKNILYNNWPIFLQNYQY